MIDSLGNLTSFGLNHGLCHVSPQLIARLPWTGEEIVSLSAGVA
jgi:hypothetical protein